MQSYLKLLLENKSWAKEKVEVDPDFFTNLAKLQTPEFLWIGCSDSRVSADQITGTQPGEIFVHRNIANLVVNTDVNLMAVLDYAINHLKVKHVIVCGHYGCGGVKASMCKTDLKYILNMWLRNIKDIQRIYEEELNNIADEEKRYDRLVELNVKEQVLNLAKSSIIQNAWKGGDIPHLHGWVYSLNDGIIKPVFEMKAGTKINSIYEFE
ncbi:MAG TPA: carbonic anhydrase [Chitinophagaceae bacterium]|nr:carbonic anhydrase [Chitinophagaceae bacterium]MCC6635561.1 carbonic anhydrase [Chitinophagaceae bacterium]HMZ46859.1 carbonic anhydrase [Chitinophagaceae bacterium]HNE93240.1 carbonic anhydrase [Chitinophagaceae bacterium]HNF29744.1 carbonic anhydrase [Chitinophagaceae bacterium]